jgi:hypothetical protein
MDAFYDGAHFLFVLDHRAVGVNGMASMAGWDGG